MDNWDDDLEIPKKYHGIDCVVLPSRNFNDDTHCAEVPPFELKFIVTQLGWRNNKIKVYTNLTYKSVDFCHYRLAEETKRYKGDEKKSSTYWRFNTYRPIVFEFASTAYMRLIKDLKFLFVNTFKVGQEVVFKVRDVDITNYFGRDAIELGLEPIVYGDYAISVAKIQFDKDAGMNYESMMALLMGLGANIRKFTEGELDANEQKYRDVSIQYQKKRENIQLKKERQITPDKGKQIIQMRDEQKMTFDAIAKYFGVDKATIIRNHRKYKPEALA